MEGGEALWNKLDQSFNNDLLALLEEMRTLKESSPGIAAQLAKTEKFVEEWDGRTQIFHDAKPPGQLISAEQLRVQIAQQLGDARAAIKKAKTPVPVVTPTPLPEPKKKPAAKTPAPTKAKVIEPEPEPEPAQVTEKAEETVTVHTPPAQVTVRATPKEAPVKKPKVDQREAARLKAQEAREERERVNAQKRKEQEARVAIAERFGAAMRSETEKLLRGEKINGWANVYNELDVIMAAAKLRVRGEPDPTRALEVAYNKWVIELQKHRDANKLDKQGSLPEWRARLGLQRYVIIEAGELQTSTHTEAVPEAGTEGPSGPTHTYSVHVTLDPNQVRVPTRPLNEQTVDELVNDLLSVSNVALRIHATLEGNGAEQPHVYWPHLDIGQGYRYEWGMAAWNAPGGGKEQVGKVLTDYVASVIKPRVKLEHDRLTFTPYAWPTFAVLSAPVLAQQIEVLV